jgi:hypothetical protein
MDRINERQMGHIKTGTVVCLCEQWKAGLVNRWQYSLDMILLFLLKVEAYDHIQKNPTLSYILNIFKPVLPYVVVKYRIP